MNRLFFIITVCLLFALNTFAQSALSEEDQVRETLWKYINGRNNGDTSLLASAFHPTAELRYIKGDQYAIWKSEDYIKGVQPGRKVNCISRIIFVDILGNAAVAKIELEYPNLKFADYINLLKVDGEWVIAVKTFARQRIAEKQRVLFVLTSHEKMGDTDRKTGLHLGEVTHAYKPIHDAGYEIDFVSPKGGSTYMYGANMNDSLNLWFIQNPTAYYRFQHAMRPDEIDPSRYAAIYFVGGHGTMWDLPKHDKLNRLTADIYEDNGVVAAVCHGPSGLVNVKLSNGDYLVNGKQLTAFTDEEERAAQAENIVPFMLESKLRERGAKFVGADNWQKNVIVDGRLLTGQNPASAYELGQAIVEVLEK
ncbi:MAG: nuclear transport factor 2 family protein [Bacteroidota bacterium]